MLLQQKQTNPTNIRKHFLHDLDTFIKECTAQAEDIVIGGNFNDIIGSTSTGMAALCRSNHLTDAIHHVHGSPATPFATWTDGNDVLDCILVSPNILPHITSCGYEPFLANIHGDHRGMFVDLNTFSLFGSPDTQLFALTPRHLKSTNLHHVTTHFEHNHEYLKKHNFFSCLERLKEYPSHELAERLDRTRIQAALFAENQLPQHPDVPYSPAIVRLQNRLGLLRLLLFQHNHGIDLHAQLKTSILQQYEHFVFPDTLASCKSQYNSALC